MHKLSFAAMAAFLVAFAGCAAPDLEGTVQDSSHQQPASGAANVVYQPFTGQAGELQLLLGDFLYLQAPSSGGPFVLSSGATGVTVQGAFLGSNAEFTVFGLPPSNHTYMGRLYLPGATDAVEEFPVQNGPNAYPTKRPAAEYGEFHIHVGDSKVNLYKGTFQVKEE